MKQAMNRKKRAEELVKHLNSIRDNDGYAAVDVMLGDGRSTYNPISCGEKRDLADDIYDYIDEQTNIVPASVPLKIRFHGAANEDERQNIKNALNGHYKLKLLEASKRLATNFTKMVFLALFGAVMLTLYFYLSYATDRMLSSEILSIIGTFSLWEAVNAFLLERPQLRRDLRHVNQHLTQCVEFVDCDAAATGEKQ